MRVLHVESGRYLYGGARQVGYLIEGLATRGVENVLACPPAHPLTHASLPAAICELPMGGDLDVGLARRLRHAIRRYRPDVVHAHSRRGADLFTGWASRAMGRPAILTRRVDNPEPVVWARFKYRPYRFVVAISRAIERQLREHLGLQAARLRHIPSAVDADRYRPDSEARARLLEQFRLPQTSFVIGVVAQLIARKGHDLLLDALPELLGRFPQIRVLLFGRGSEEKRLRRAIRRAGLGRCVELAGYHDAMPRILPGLDLLVHPAEREGLGLALLEAMSCGVAVVATSVGGVVDIVETETTGLLIPPRSRSALVVAVARLISDEAERRSLAQTARTRSGERFTIEAMTERYLEVYADVRG